MFSKTCEYGIKAVVYIAMQSLKGYRVKIGDVVNNTGTPEAFTAKILGTLTKANVIQSYKGPNGGFEIDKTKMHSLYLSQIIHAIDGDAVYNGCGLGLQECNADEPCPLHEKFVSIRAQLKKMVETTTLFELATKLEQGESILLR